VEFVHNNRVRKTDLADRTPMNQVPYRWYWKWSFWWERLLLRLVLGRRVGKIDHFGSTSIPGMPGKPIVDLQIAIDDSDFGFELHRIIERLGYEYHGENIELHQHLFTKGNPIRFNLYFLNPRSETWRKRTVFRDYLRRDDRKSDWIEYRDLKAKLAMTHAEDIRAYQDGKLEFVDRIVEQATTFYDGAGSD